MTDGHEARKVTRQAKVSLLVLVCLSVALMSVAVAIVWAELRESLLDKTNDERPAGAPGGGAAHALSLFLARAA